ncbi:iron chelate uptake ABC transporter family permease subunit [Phytohabitans sp. ZYX-F-186]|uniref:Iron chelate uptake ABC transporter family permease subunit n=1 Tax=Phytohabitans maris TaxID=3071409 RepID=A0ABU0ZP20_9ACTN|nr:iron chelate uptake ABC transporter family permease subunit [Phytohabitans sp. ZYX-F-186]MDQ7908794.1 iron chelate uptake ABC transporter family permease subunit [Phytohabitans sp. ZYX-F-186]
MARGTAATAALALVYGIAFRRTLSGQVWLIGSLNGRRWDHVRPLALALAVLLLVLHYGRKLALLELGDDTASSRSRRRGWRGG